MVYNFDLIVLRLDTAATSLPALAREGVAGVNIASMLQSRGEREYAVARLAASLGMPVSLYGYPPEGTDREVSGWDTVRSDHRGGGRLVTEWVLRDKGCRRPLPYRRVKSVAQSNGQPPIWWQLRLAGYRDAMTDHGLSPLDPLEIDAVWGDEA